MCFLSVAHTQVIDGDVILNTQAEVDSFAGTSISGNLTISGNDISNLSALSTLDSVNGYLLITHNDSLTTLDGLNNITTVGGSLDISNNDVLVV
ncbi:MAG: hypothetical protein OQK82_01380, partial [Candidatus Pacearchaeota archaeon]|nr:hypothetical protein [Candidatus Pacearchaeota archaeon]